MPALYFKVHLTFLFENISFATKPHQIFYPGLKSSRSASWGEDGNYLFFVCFCSVLWVQKSLWRVLSTFVLKTLWLHVLSCALQMNAFVWLGFFCLFVSIYFWIYSVFLKVQSKLSATCNPCQVNMGDYMNRKGRLDAQKLKQTH